MSESEFNCKKYKFKRYSNVSGFLAFDKNKMSVGFDEVCLYMTSLENQLKEANEVIEFYSDDRLYIESYDDWGNEPITIIDELNSTKRAREYLEKYKAQ